MITIEGWTTTPEKKMATAFDNNASIGGFCTEKCRKKCLKKKQCCKALPDGTMWQDALLVKFFDIEKYQIDWQEATNTAVRQARSKTREDLIAKYRNIIFDKCRPVVVTIRRLRSNQKPKPKPSHSEISFHRHDHGGLT